MRTIQKRLSTIVLSSAVAIGALSANPVEADTRESVNRAIALARRSGLATALALVEASCLRAEAPECRHNRGVLLAQLQQFDEAARIFGEMVRQGRAFPETRLAHGELLLQLDRNQEAAAELEVAAGLRPADPFAHYNLGVALARLGRHRESADAFAVAARLDPRFDQPNRPRRRVDHIVIPWQNP